MGYPGDGLATRLCVFPPPDVVGCLLDLVVEVESAGKREGSVHIRRLMRLRQED